MSFRTRLSLLAAAAVGVAVAIAAMVSYFVVRGQLYSNFDTQLQHQASVQVQSARRGRLDPGDLFSAGNGSENGGKYDFNAGPVLQLLVNGVANPILPTNVALPATPLDRDVASGNHPTVIRNVTVDGISERMITTALANNVQVILPNGNIVLADTLALQLAQPLTYLDHTLRDLRIYLLLIGLGGIVAALVVGDLVARATIRPVERLTAAAEHVAVTQQLDATIEEEGDDELTRLAHSFNSMLRALGASRQQQAQLVADAGHELRTPLTSLRTNIEVLMRVGDLPPEDRAELLNDVHGQLEELTTLVGDLVELAREDEQNPEPEDVRLDIIVERAVERARRRATSLTFEVNLTDSLVRGQPALLERAVLNVLDNAAKWSPPGGAVTVRLTRADGWDLTIRDLGPGIAPEDLPYVFDRFYRASSARSMPGSGLGLAIVDQVVRSHGGTVSLTCPLDGGTVVHIHLPAIDREAVASAGPPPVEGLDASGSGQASESHQVSPAPH